MAINDPRDIPGLLAWYSAEAETGYADGANMTGWTDRSGLGNHATVVGTAPKWQSTTGPSGGASVRFAGTSVGYFALPSAILSTATAGDVFFKVKVDSGSGTTSGLHSFTQTGTSGTRYHATSIQENFARNSLGTSSVTFTPTLSTTAWRTYNVWGVDGSGGGLVYWEALLDGQSQATSTANLPTFTSSPAIGTAWRGSAPVALTAVFPGNVSLFVLYSRKLSDTERADLNAWINAHPSGGTPAAAGSVAANLPGTLPALGGAFTGSIPQPVDANAAATLPALTAAFSGDVPTQTSLAGVLPALTGGFTATAPDAANESSLAGVLPTLTGLFETVEVASEDAAVDETDRANGRTRAGRSFAVVEYPLDAEPPNRVPIRSMAQSVPAPNLVDGRPS